MGAVNLVCGEGERETEKIWRLKQKKQVHTKTILLRVSAPASYSPPRTVFPHPWQLYCFGFFHCSFPANIPPTTTPHKLSITINALTLFNEIYTGMQKIHHCAEPHWLLEYPRYYLMLDDSNDSKSWHHHKALLVPL